MNILKQSLLVIALMPLMANAVTPADEQVTGTVALQGGSDSSVKYSAPATSAYKVHVFVPKTGSAINTLYRIYPKGKRVDSATCVSSDSKFPCYEATVDQTLYPNSWRQLTLNNNPTTQWDFVKGKGYVTAVVSNLNATDMLNLSALARFENMTIAIGKTYQGGIIFYINGTGKHGLIAAPTDQIGIPGIQWSNGTYITTGATGTVVGSGRANTNEIIKAQGAGTYAAMLCAKLVIGAYSDWYLPSSDELNLMYQNIGQGAATPLTNVGGFAGDVYWSSSDVGGSFASSQNFGSGQQFYGMIKDVRLDVRAVRAF